jgi:hypothetical protein
MLFNICYHALSKNSSLKNASHIFLSKNLAVLVSEGAFILKKKGFFSIFMSKLPLVYVHSRGRMVVRVKIGYC